MTLMPDMEEEIWKPVRGFEGQFEVSNMGRVRRLYDEGREGWRIMKQTPHGCANSYLVVNLSREGARATGRRHRPGDYRPGTRKYCKVHTLVLEAFVGPRPRGMQACHRNSNGHDNRLDNLRWDTWESNCKDMVLSGKRKGENNGRSKLTKEQVAEIREAAKSYRRGLWKELAERYGVSNTQISNIALNKAGGWQDQAHEALAV